MTTTFFVDTNILIYAQDPTNREKQAVAATWLKALAARNAIVVSPQVVSEYCHVVRRKFKDRSAEDLRTYVGLLQRYCVAPATFGVAVRGLEIHLDTGYQIFDCNLIAAAQSAGCKVFLSEDLQHGRLVEDLRILDPFEAEPDKVLASN